MEEYDTKASLLRFFSTQYISPLTKLFYQIESHKKRLAKQLVTLQIANPSSWLHQDSISPIAIAEDPYATLQRIRLYLDNPNNNVFDGQYALKTAASIPYFEWLDNACHYAISDFLGSYLFICLVAQTSLEEIKFLKKFIHTSEHQSIAQSQVLLIGTALEKALCAEALVEQKTYWIDIDQSITKNIYIKYSLQNEGFIKIFNPIKPLLLVSPEGKLLQLFSKQEIYKLNDSINKNTFMEANPPMENA